MPSAYYATPAAPASAAGAPIGQRIRDACALLERVGPSGANALCDHLTDIEPSNMGKYCSRAVGFGLMTVERGIRGRVQYSIFTVVPGWREIADQRRTTRPVQRHQSRWQGVASVFQLGGAIVTSKKTTLHGGRHNTTVRHSVYRITCVYQEGRES
jgi:hypothetical protein